MSFIFIIDRAYYEHEDQYKSEIAEQKSRTDQALLEIQHLKSKLTNIQKEKTMNEDDLNRTIETLQQENEKLLNDQSKTSFSFFI